MYLHLGQETLVKTEDIVGIFDMDNTTISKWTRKYLNQAEKKGRVISVTLDLPKTFVVIKPGGAEGKSTHRHRPQGEEQVYLSQISAATLRKRTGYNYATKLY